MTYLCSIPENFGYGGCKNAKKRRHANFNQHLLHQGLQNLYVFCVEYTLMTTKLNSPILCLLLYQKHAHDHSTNSEGNNEVIVEYCCVTDDN